jgi:hypothetical protein
VTVRQHDFDLVGSRRDVDRAAERFDAVDQDRTHSPTDGPSRGQHHRPGRHVALERPVEAHVKRAHGHVCRPGSIVRLHQKSDHDLAQIQVRRAAGIAQGPAGNRHRGGGNRASGDIECQAIDMASS